MSGYEVVVVGAGLAGLTVAGELAERGVRVALIDRKADLHAPVHTTGIFVRKTLEEPPFPERFLGPPVRDVVLYSPARRPLHLRSEQDEFRVGDMGAIYSWMAARCAARGVDWIPNTHFVTSGEGTVTVSSGGVPRTLVTQIVVGADGCSSRVARHLGLDTNREWIVGVEEVLTGVPLDGPPRFECVLDPGLAPGYLAWLVHDGNHVHLGVGGYPARFDPGRALAAFRAEAARRLDFSGARLLERRGGRIPVGGVLRRIGSARGLLVGDAAGAVSPLTAGGLDGAIRLSRLAAAAVAESLAGGDLTLLCRYSGEIFRSRFLSRRWMRAGLRAAGWAPLLEAGCALLRTSAGKRFAWHVFFGRGSFPDVELAQLPILDSRR
jgi:flavin-dependent dehydrogenase